MSNWISSEYANEFVIEGVGDMEWGWSIDIMEIGVGEGRY